MPLQLVRQDITKMRVDAIVNAANESLLGGGGVDGAIHRAAGPALLDECRKLGGCHTGSAKITGAYRLHAKYIIHTVGPIWQGGGCHERDLLTSCYRKSLELAKEHACESVAFPLISSGIYGYPKAEALQVAVNAISEFLLENDMHVYIVVFDRSAVRIGEKLFSDIQEYIDDNYVDKHRDTGERIRQRRLLAERQAAGVLHPIEPEKSARAAAPNQIKDRAADQAADQAADWAADQAADRAADQMRWTCDDLFAEASLAEALEQIDESFSQMLLRKIDEAGMKDSECYKKANIDRKLFSKIRSDIHYKPSKQTAIAFAIALELSYEETADMLMKAGYALSHSSKFDIIIEYFIRHGQYNILEINEALFAFDQSLLGS